MTDGGSAARPISDYRPLEKVALPGIGAIKCEGLIVIVGPNSSGKSRFLQDVYAKLRGATQELVVATEIELAQIDHDGFVASLQAEGYISVYDDDSGNTQVKPLTIYLGAGEPIQAIPLTQAKNWYQEYAPSKGPKRRRTIDYLNYFGRMLVNALFLDRRLTGLGAAGMIDFENQPPQHDLHALWLNQKAQADLATEIRGSFQRAVWPDITRGTQICLRVAEQANIPPAEDRLSFVEMNKFRTIETEGDGLKSYVTICVALSLGRRPITLIDEPEMCLHPPQAYNLGRFIGSHGANPERTTFVATHSSHILRGILQSTKSLQIIRLTRGDDGFFSHLVPASTLETALSKPTLRAETILDGIFSQGVIVVEADTDRLVYHTVMETLSGEFSVDAHFATVGGVGGIAGTCNLYRALHIPVAVVADLDLITNIDRLSSVLAPLAEPQKAGPIIGQVTLLLEELRKLPPSIEPDDARQQIASIGQQSFDWLKRDDGKIRTLLMDVARQLDRMRRLKRGGVNALPAPISSRLEMILESLKGVGVFLVPIGELEEWLASETIDAPKSNKWAWANAAAQRIQEKGAVSGDIWDFMRGVASYLAATLATDASAREEVQHTTPS